MPEPTYTLKQITDAVKLIGRARAEQWIARGYFRAPQEPIFGSAREWGIGDAIRLAVCTSLVESGISPQRAGQLSSIWTGLHGFKNDVTYLVISTGMLGEIIPSTPYGGAGTKIGEGRKVYVPGTLYDDIIKGSDLVKTLADPDRYVSIVINLDNIEFSVKAALGYTPDDVQNRAQRHRQAVRTGR
jgi:hypothetical protein